MFQKAYQEAANYTRPVVICHRQLGGTVSAGPAAFFIVNDEGWAFTAAHVFLTQIALQQHAADVATYKAELADINTKHLGNDNKRVALIKRVAKDPNWVTHATYWWGANGITVAENYIYSHADVALLRLSDIGPLNISTFPRFRDPGSLAPGMSLMKIGYPFVTIDAKFDESTARFDVGKIELPYFPIEGILTRFIKTNTTTDGITAEYVESSSPGLKGQSGGPTVDLDGIVCAMQSSTQSYPLGFSPEVKDKGKAPVKEHQFLSAGWGVHTSALKAVLDKHGVRADWA